ncbi:MAG: hypothetical protein IKP69_08740 [Oscillospiraceae bacterium]|nr:hypothetical protein [Oscillospiraceae bacterium]
MVWALKKLHVNKLTIKEFEQKITGDEKFHDQYGAVLETNALKNLTLRCDSDINQSFSHADETDWYLYTLVMNVENPVCTKNSYPDSVEKFYIDFEYKPENGYSNETKTYRLDMSWNDTRNLNENCLQKFRNEDETPFVTELTIWLPGILQKMNVFLEMRDLNLLHMAKNDRLTVQFSDIRLNGFNINRNIDYISSAGGESKAEISCIAPSALINLQYLDETSTKQALDAINNANTEYQFKDQYGAIVSSILVKKAMEEMQDCFNVALNSSDTSIKEYSVSVENQAMSGSLYHASQNEIIQEYMEQKILEKRMQMQ